MIGYRMCAIGRNIKLSKLCAIIREYWAIIQCKFILDTEILWQLVVWTHEMSVQNSFVQVVQLSLQRFTAAKMLPVCIAMLLEVISGGSFGLKKT